MKRKYCRNCEQFIKPRKRFNWPIFLLLCITGIGGIFYLIFYFLFARAVCPICQDRNLISKRKYQKEMAHDDRAQS